MYSYDLVRGKSSRGPSKNRPKCQANNAVRCIAMQFFEGEKHDSIHHTRQEYTVTTTMRKPYRCCISEIILLPRRPNPTALHTYVPFITYPVFPQMIMWGPLVALPHRSFSVPWDEC